MMRVALAIALIAVLRAHRRVRGVPVIVTVDRHTLECGKVVKLLALLLLVACYGTPGTADDPPEPLPPNVELACSRAVECGAVDADHFDECVECVETVADQWNARAAGLYPGKSINDMPCEALVSFAEEHNLTRCAAEGWRGP